jgi:hypothetical protein
MKKIALMLIILMVIGTGFLSGCEQPNPFNKSPTASASGNPMNGTPPLTVYFLGTGSDPDGSITSYLWNFKDGQTSTQQNPTHIFQNSGIYEVTLTVYDDKNATGTAVVIITITGIPTQFVITTQSKRDAYEGTPPNRVGYVDVTVKNVGGSGSKTIQVKVTQDDNYWTKEQTIYLDKDESESLVFRFSEIKALADWSFIVTII